MPKASFRDTIHAVARTRSSAAGVFADFCRMSACALSVLAREEEYLAVAGSYLRNELAEFSIALALLVEEMDGQPFTDVLGPFYMEVAAHSSKQARGEFFTPPELSKAMARMLIDPAAVKAAGKPISISEPACGSGGMVLTVAEMFAPDGVDLLRFTCQDINPVAVDMCYINTTLWGIPAQVFLGNTLAPKPVAEWRNPHWRRVHEDQRLTFLEIRELITSPPTVPEESEQPEAERVSQLEFDLSEVPRGKPGRQL